MDGTPQDAVHVTGVGLYCHHSQGRATAGGPPDRV